MTVTSSSLVVKKQKYKKDITICDPKMQKYGKLFEKILNSNFLTVEIG
jgi:hypothetical protein